MFLMISDCKPQLVTAGSLIVFLRPHIVSKLGYVLSAATMVTAIARSPVFIPPKNRAEIVPSSICTITS